MRPRAVFLAVSTASFASPAAAHGAEPDAGWFGDPLVTALILLPVAAYALGYANLARSGRDRVRSAPRAKVTFFALGIAGLVIALLSPLDGYADASFAWHMGQHLMLMMLAAPLLAASDAHLVMLRAFPIGARRAIGRSVAAVPGVRRGAHSNLAAWLAFAIFSAAVWLWHLPGAYDAAVRSDGIHTLEHLSFLATAIAFWRVIGTSGGRRLGIGTSILMVTLVGLQGAMLAALITLAPRPLYASYAAAPDALADQVRAGVLMWVPASLVYLASSVLALRRLMAPARRLRRI